MKNNLLRAALSGLLLIACMHLSAQIGATCAAPIPLGRDYSASITSAGTKWYVANTFDLPLTVKFYPSNNNVAPPDIEMDFSCTSGVYEDSILCSLFCRSGTYISLPHIVTPNRKTDEQGRVYYEVAMGERYRDMLLQAGISYDVNVYIKVTYYGRGNITLTPDAEFSQCMETDKWLLLGRTLQVDANDDQTFFIAPYANWQQDSVRYIWSGSQPATVVIGTTCDFDPLDGWDDRRVDVMPMKAGSDTVNHTNADILYYMTYMQNPTNTAKGGIFYVKVVSAGTGTLKVERMPAAPPQGGATILKYNHPTSVTGETAALYAIPPTWTSATRFDTPTDRVFKMHIGNTADFLLEDAIASCSFNATDSGHWFGFTQQEMETLWTQTRQKYLYVRFESSQTTTVTPTLWEPSECISNTEAVLCNSTVDIASRSKVIYRFFYNDWKNGDMTVTWNKSTQCKMLVSGSCTIGTNGSATSVIYYEELTSGTTYTVPASEIAEWADYVDADGYVFMRFYTTSAAGGQITLHTTAPAETDPVVPHITVSVTCLESTTGVQIRVSTPQTIRILDVAGSEIWQQTVQPDQPQSVPLQPATYTLIGEYEQVEIQL